tara:strand:+ start:37 stop:690 length:654 start_codon:yes stop_codon:yes gene_type:complete
VNSKNNKNLIIIGSGSHSRVVFDVACSMGEFENFFFFDLNIKVDRKIKISNHDFDLLNISKINYLDENHNSFIIAIGDNKIREKTYKELKDKKFKPTNIISNRSIISANVKIGKGNFINHGVIINSDTRIGNNNIINTSVSIDHHNIIKNNTHLSPGVLTAGSVKICSDVLVGPGSIIDKNVTINQGTIISSGVILTKDVERNKTVFQDRKQIIKKN